MLISHIKSISIIQHSRRQNDGVHSFFFCLIARQISWPRSDPIPSNSTRFDRMQAIHFNAMHHLCSAFFPRQRSKPSKLNAHSLIYTQSYSSKLSNANRFNRFIRPRRSEVHAFDPLQNSFVYLFDFFISIINLHNAWWRHTKIQHILMPMMLIALLRACIARIGVRIV